MPRRTSTALATAAAATAVLLAPLALAPAAQAAGPAPAVCGGTALDWTAPGPAGAVYQGVVRFRSGAHHSAYAFLANLTTANHRLAADETDGTGQWELRHYYGGPGPSVLYRSHHGATVLDAPRCEDPAHPTRVTSTTATVEDHESGRLTRVAL
ncbi:hypothetical protein ACFYVL_28460 [Streptomyces sp. NPDC004111]|uniref:hypothetical protein n=1 Tax=Streptomyces sp. NPDC004111 TaxID=3364690 RepID=UPI00369C38BE